LKTTPKHAVLISIRPRFAEMIFDGSKTVELRRVCQTMSPGDLALVYVSFPAKELRGIFEAGKIISAAPRALWPRVKKRCGLTRKEFFAYFDGKDTAHSITIKRSWKLSEAVCLTALRRRRGGFRPPQNFFYLNGKGHAKASSFAVSNRGRPRRTSNHSCLSKAG
jgi:predicted transcriptional regulator